VAIKATFCRVQGVIKPSADSDIKFEVWLPPENSWNGRYGAIGNGGFAGSLILPAMASRVAEGYAVSGTDTGHPGGSLDAGWALGHPEKIADLAGAPSMKLPTRPNPSSATARRPANPILRVARTGVARR
jgi:hypothetical protein